MTRPTKQRFLVLGTCYGTNIPNKNNAVLLCRPDWTGDITLGFRIFLTTRRPR
jgi:hypothetical protein